MTIEQRKIDLAAQNGLDNTDLAAQVADETGVPFAVVCAFLEQESGGRNVWGHDGTWMIGYPVMNKSTYAVYKAHRSRFGNQGVGPLQLTSPGWQDQADSLGGCWDPYFNMLAAFRGIASMYDDLGDWHAVAVRYNGSTAYGDQLMARVVKWRGIFK